MSIGGDGARRVTLGAGFCAPSVRGVVLGVGGCAELGVADPRESMSGALRTRTSSPPACLDLASVLNIFGFADGTGQASLACDLSWPLS